MAKLYLPDKWTLELPSLTSQLTFKRSSAMFYRLRLYQSDNFLDIFYIKVIIKNRLSAQEIIESI